MALNSETTEPSGLFMAEIQSEAPLFFSRRRKYRDEVSPSSAHLTLERTLAPSAAIESKWAIRALTFSKTGNRESRPSSICPFKWSKRLESTDLAEESFLDLSREKLIIIPFKRSLPRSHHLWRET